ncbi:low density lipoprotein receptor adapter protein 1-B-like isoform X2 [Rhinatrema bivittatum]|uniref:low density lipoprotein receptor adapter protein 1-B-like isoform X2 n=1 Tax=Rhinatrema bivittatum TaxID=194408 RepID=UPI00112A75A2|nr:low density lipoprotein receptor adapter protein 1-B-like isoform X2 [Rhinatrema bivittatum]
MDALKSAGRAILRSPSIARHSLGGCRHQKLPENWTDTKETLQEGMLFQLKYLGMTLVGKPKGEDMAAAAIKRIITMARVSTKKFQKVTLTVSPRGILLQDSDTNELIENVSIYRISYCTTDKVQNKVFAYVAQNQSNETLECHAFLSPKKKIAQAVALTVAQAFKVALDLWEAAREGKGSTCSRSCCHSQLESCCETKPHVLELGSRHRSAPLFTDRPSINPLCSTDAEQPQCMTQLQAPASDSPFRVHSGEDDDDDDEDLEEAFSRTLYTSL